MRRWEEPRLLVFMERLIGFILLILGAVLLHGTYVNQSGLGLAPSIFFTIISVALILLGLIMLFSKVE